MGVMMARFIGPADFILQDVADGVSIGHTESLHVLSIAQVILMPN
jgi:hypothetical protein